MKFLKRKKELAAWEVIFLIILPVYLITILGSLEGDYNWIIGWLLGVVLYGSGRGMFESRKALAVGELTVNLTAVSSKGGSISDLLAKDVEKAIFPEIYDNVYLKVNMLQEKGDPLAHISWEAYAKQTIKKERS